MCYIITLPVAKISWDCQDVNFAFNEKFEFFTGMKSFEKRTYSNQNINFHDFTKSEIVS